MKQRRRKGVKEITALIIAGLFFTSACATTNYVPKHSGMIKIMPKGYQKDDQLFKGGKGLMKAVESNEEALRYAKKARKNNRWATGLLWGGVATYITSVSLFDNNRPNSSPRNTAAFSLLGVGLASVISSIFPAIAANANKTDAINKYNDDVLQRLAPQIFTAPVPEIKSKEETKQESKKGLESSVITVQQKGEMKNE